MKTAVIFKSHYGSTETYANWLAEDLGADLLQADRVRPDDLRRYDTIVYGGGLYAGGVNGVSLLADNFESIKDKGLYLFTVGASDMTSPENIKNIRAALEQKLPPALLQKLHIYHLRGGLHYSKMGFFHRMMMNMMIKMLRKKPENERSHEEHEMLKSVNQDTDFTSREAIAPLVTDIRASAAQRQP